MNFTEWEQTVPNAITNDPLWSVTAYRLVLFAADIGWPAVTRLSQDQRTISLADQLYRALGSISANIAEGYSKSSGKDRVRFYEYALGSAQESRDWYYKARHVLGEAVVAHRYVLLSQIIRLLLTLIPDQRYTNIKDDSATYELLSADHE